MQQWQLLWCDDVLVINYLKSHSKCPMLTWVASSISDHHCIKYVNYTNCRFKWNRSSAFISQQDKYSYVERIYFFYGDNISIFLLFFLRRQYIYFFTETIYLFFSIIAWCIRSWGYSLRYMMIRARVTCNRLNDRLTCTVACMRSYKFLCYSCWCTYLLVV